MTEPTTRAAVVLLHAAAAALPVVGGSVAVVLGAVEERRQARVAGMLDVAGTGLADQALDDLEDLLAHDERLQHLILDACEAAAGTRSTEARAAVGSAVAGALRGDPIDVEELVITAVEGLAVAHVKVIWGMRRQDLLPVQTKARGKYEGAAVEDRQLEALIEGLGTAVVPVLAELERRGLAQVVAQAYDPLAWRTWALTAFGREVAGRLGLPG